MNRVKPFFASCLAGLAVMLLLGWLPHAAWKDSGKRSEVAVFQPAPVVRLTSNNLVDVLVAIPFNERLVKVEWSSGMLSVDLRLSKSDRRASAFFSDMEKLVRVSFVQLENVKRLLIRVIEDNPEGSILLAAADVRRTDNWLQYDIDGLALADPVHDDLWRNRLRLSLTSAWEERFGYPSSYSARPAAR